MGGGRGYPHKTRSLAQDPNWAWSGTNQREYKERVLGRQIKLINLA